MLTIQESIERDELLDVDRRNHLLEKARQIIHLIYNLSVDAVGKAQTEQVLVDSKLQLLKKNKEALSFVKTAESYSDSERTTILGGESASLLVSLALPEERFRIQELLNHFPEGLETKSKMLFTALSQIWAYNPNEKMQRLVSFISRAMGLDRGEFTKKEPAKMGVEDIP